MQLLGEGIIKCEQTMLLSGPITAMPKYRFQSRYGRETRDHLLDRSFGMETVHHPSDGQLLAYARIYFTVADRMAGVRTDTLSTRAIGARGQGGMRIDICGTTPILIEGNR